MILGLLDAQIKAMNGKQLADHLFRERVGEETPNGERECHLFLNRLELVGLSGPYQLNEMKAELARIIDDLRSADRA